MTTFHLSFKSCEAVIFIDKKTPFIASIQSIVSKEPGKGHARGLMEMIETILKNKKKVKEIWYPSVLSLRLEHLLEGMGYRWTNFGKHPKMPYAEDVTGYRKVLK